MKKKSIGLKAKLFLGKEVISTLNGLNLNHVVGGGTGASDCLQCYSQPVLSCANPCNSVLCPQTLNNLCVGPTVKGCPPLETNSCAIICGG